MAKMKDLVYGNTEQLEQLFNGQTVSGHTYNENDLYVEELGDDIELGATGSGTQINGQNQLVVIGKEDTSNKVTTITSSSTDTQYPSAKLLYDQLALKENADNTILKKANVKNNTSSTDTDLPLSANMGKSLQDQVNNLKNIGRFLSIWNATTGAPSTEPTESPYSFKVGDYYRVGTAGTRNPAPNSTYTTGGTNWVEGSALEVGSVVYVSNISGSTSTWVVQAAGGGGTVQDVQINGTTIVASGTGIANINVGDGLSFNTSTLTVDTNTIQSKINSSNKLSADLISDGSTNKTVTQTEKNTWNAKQNALSTQTAYSAKGSGTKVPQITTNTLGQVTGITEVDITKTTLTDLGITATSTELNYVDGVTSNIQTQLNNKQASITSSAKLGADLVDDTNTTNKFVTASEKTSIGTALQPNDNITQLNNNAGYITSSYHDSTKQDTLIGTETTGQNIKTINGNSILGSGNLSTITYEEV